MSKLSTKLADIDNKWLHYLEKHGVKTKTHWWQNSLDCSKPQFLPHAKKFWTTLSKDEKQCIKVDNEHAQRDLFYYLSIPHPSFRKAFYSYQKQITETKA